MRRLRRSALALTVCALATGCGGGAATTGPATRAASAPAGAPSAGAPSAPAAPSAAATGVSRTGTSAAALPPLPADAVVVGSGSRAGCTEGALRAALRTVQRRGRGTVGFDCGAAPVTIAVTAPLVLSGDGSARYTVDGRGTVTLDGRRRSGLFVLPSAQGLSVTFRRLRMVNARSATQGAAVHGGWRNRLVIEDCTFAGNATTSTATAFDGGGAVYVHEGSAVVRRSVFEGNTAGNGGGLQNTVGDVLVEDSVFRRNRSTVRGSGGGGGAIYSDAGSLVVRRTEIRDNRALLQGGGLFLYNATDRRTLVEDSVIAGNRVTDAPDAFGGGVRAGAGPVAMLRTRVEDNDAAGQGGGLYVANGARVTLTACTFLGNTAGQGGAVFRVDGRVTVTRTTFRGNRPANVL